MNKQQYMDELVKKLAVFGDEIKDEIVSDYEEHFRMGLANGKNEEQICKELGSIDELVDELNKLTGKAENTSQGQSATEKQETREDDVKKAIDDSAEQFAQGLGDAMNSLAGFLGNLAATVAKNTEKFAADFGEKAGDTADTLKNKANEYRDNWNEKNGDKVEVFKTKANEFVGKSEGYAKKAASDLGAVAKDFAEKTKAFAKEIGATYRQSMNREASEAAAQEDSDGIDALAREIVNDEEGLSSRCGASNEPADSVIIETDCGNVIVNSNEESDRIKFNYENNGSVNQQLAYGFDFRQEGKTIYAVAKKKPGSTNFFKSISCPDIELTIELPEGLKNLSIRSMSGEVECEDIAVEQVTITTMSGDISIGNGMIKALEANTMSGDISLTDTSVSGMSLITVSGDIEVVDGGADTLNAKTTSGDVDITDCATGDVTAASVSGDLSVSFEDISGYLAHVKTTCGDISLEFGGESLDVIRGGSYVLGNGEIKLNLSTVSGDIEVEG